MPFRPPSQSAQSPGGESRFPGFDVLDQTERWDDVTAGVVLSRLDPHPDYSFFTPAEQATADALFDRLLAQDQEPKVPVLHMVDQRLALDMTDGWFYEGMPEDCDAWRQTLAALDEDARRRHQRPFHALEPEVQGGLLQAIFQADEWHGWKASRVWSLWTRYACAAFYSHPWAWNEIGFGGPAYPRGYKNMGVDKREGWEVADAVGNDPVEWGRLVEDAQRRQARMARAPGDESADGSDGVIIE